MKKFAFICAVLLLICVLPAFSLWVYLSVDELIERSDLVAEATVKLPEEIAKNMEEGDTILKLRTEKDVIVPVTFIVNEIIKNNDVLDENQTEITVDVPVIGTGGYSGSSASVDHVLSEGEKAVFFFKKTDKGLGLIYYPTYKLSKDDNGLYKDRNIKLLEKYNTL